MDRTVSWYIVLRVIALIMFAFAAFRVGIGDPSREPERWTWGWGGVFFLMLSTMFGIFGANVGAAISVAIVLRIVALITMLIAALKYGDRLFWSWGWGGVFLFMLSTMLTKWAAS